MFLGRLAHLDGKPEADTCPGPAGAAGDAAPGPAGRGPDRMSRQATGRDEPPGACRQPVMSAALLLLLVLVILAAEGVGDALVGGVGLAVDPPFLASGNGLASRPDPTSR